MGALSNFCYHFSCKRWNLGTSSGLVHTPCWGCNLCKKDWTRSCSIHCCSDMLLRTWKIIFSFFRLFCKLCHPGDHVNIWMLVMMKTAKKRMVLLLILFSHILELIWFILTNPLPGTLPGLSSNPSSHLCPDKFDLGYLDNLIFFRIKNNNKELWPFFLQPIKSWVFSVFVWQDWWIVHLHINALWNNQKRKIVSNKGYTFAGLGSIQSCNSCAPFYTRSNRIQDPEKCDQGFLSI